MQDKNRFFSAIIVYGALWGFLEATLGWALHWLPALLSGSVMFPVGAAILLRARRQSGTSAVMPWIGAVAAAIKTVDFLLPVPTVLKVFYPMLCILLETVVVLVVAKAIEDRPTWRRLVLFPAASVAWRLLYLGALVIQFWVGGPLSAQITSVSAVLTFAVVDGVLSGALAVGLDAVRRTIPDRVSGFFLKPAFAGLLLVAAIAATYLL